MKYLVLIASLVFLNSCCGTSTTTETAENEVELNGKFKITDLEGNSVANDELILNFDGKNHVSAKTGCNNVGSEFERTGNQISFSLGMSTKMYCEGKMENEKAIAKAFSEAKTIKSTSGDEIILISEDGKELLRAEKMK